MLKSFLYGFSCTLLVSPAALAVPLEDISAESDRYLQAQVTSVSELSDVGQTDWAYQALRSLVERYNCLAGYPDATYRGDRAMSRYEFAVSLNACLDRITELIADNSDYLRREDLMTLERLQRDFDTELADLQGRVDNLELRTAALESQQFSTTTRLVAQFITAFSDTFGNSIGSDEDLSQTYFANRSRLNLESSFTGRDLLRIRLEFGNFLDDDGNSQIALATGTGMTRLNFDAGSDNNLNAPHIRYLFPVSDSLSFVVGTAGIGYTDITVTVTPALIADDGNGVPSLFGSYNPLFRRGGGGAAANWEIVEDLTLTLGYLADNPNLPSEKNGLFNGGYNSLAHLYYLGERGAIGLAYSHGYSPGGGVNLTGGTGSLLAITPFGDNIATSNDIVASQGFYRFAGKFQIHAWGGYIWANAESSDISAVPNSFGETDTLFVSKGNNAQSWYGAIGVSFPDLGGEGNLPGILFGIPPHVVSSDVREESDNAYHLETFYSWRVNDNISMTPGFWIVFNPENNSSNDTQYVGVLRTTFDF